MGDREQTSLDDPAMLSNRRAEHGPDDESGEKALERDETACMAEGCSDAPPGDELVCAGCLDAMRASDREADYGSYRERLASAEKSLS
jgi:hypothetical protein